jgi:CheY-like chemotaxis protein
MRTRGWFVLPNVGRGMVERGAIPNRAAGPIMAGGPPAGAPRGVGLYCGMPAAPVAPVVAIFDNNENITVLLHEVLRSEGYQPVPGVIQDFLEGRSDLAAFLAEHDPAVIIWDIAAPYDRTWAAFPQVSRSAAARGRRFVLTTTNPQVVEQVAGAALAHALVGKPFELDELLAAVHRGAATATP